jgi:ABC-type antimicrobial peptide transport system permease subunit
MTLRLALRSLRAHGLRLVLSLLAVVLGVAFVAGTIIFSATVNSAVIDLFTSTGAGTDTVVRPQKAFADAATAAPGAGLRVPDSVLSQVRDLPDVAKVHGALSGYAAVLDQQGKPVGGNQIGVDWTDDPDFSVMRLVSGHAPQGADEIALDETSAEHAGVRAGDRVRVATENPVREYTLAGVFSFGASGPFGDTAIVAFAPATAQRLLAGEAGGYDQIDIHARDGVSQQRLRDQVAPALPAGLEAVTGDKVVDEQVKEAGDLLKLLQGFLLAFAVVSVFIGSFIIFNTFSMLIAQRNREMALLRAVGASRRQVTLMVLGEAAGIGIAGSTIGILAGTALALGLRALFTAVGPNLPSNSLVLTPSAIIWSYAVGVVVSMVAGYLPARRASRVPPVAALRADTTSTVSSLRPRLVVGLVLLAAAVGLAVAGLAGSGTSALVEVGAGAVAFFLAVIVIAPLLIGPMTKVLGWPFARFLGTTGRLSRDNARRNPRRTAATASALMVGLALVTTISVLAASVTTSMDRQLDAGVTADYVVTAPNSVPFSPAAGEAVAKAPGVTAAAPSRSARIQLDGTVRNATAGDPAQLLSVHRLHLVSGTAAGAPGDLLVTQKVATANGWSPGRQVKAEFQDRTSTSWRIAGVYADVKTVVSGIPEIIVRTADFRPHDPAAGIDRIDVLRAPGADEAGTERAVQTALGQWPSLKVQDRAAIKKENRTSIDLLLTLVLVLLVLSVVIAALGIVNTLALSVIERTREIGLLRAVGMQRRQVRRMIRYESVLISIFGALLGLIVGTLAGSATQQAVVDSGVDVLSVPYGRLVLYLLAGALIGMFAAIWPARRAARMDVLQAVSTE